MKKKIAIASMISFSLLSALGSVTAYAKGPGEETTITSESVVSSISTYRQATVRGMGSWEQQTDSGLWKFKLNTGGYLTNSWIESLAEANAYYYVNETGVMLTNNVTPDGYSVDITGLWRSNTTSNNSVSNPNNTSNTSNSDNGPADNERVQRPGSYKGYQPTREEQDKLLSDYLDEHFLGVGSYDSLD